MFIVCISPCSSVRDRFTKEAFTLKWLGNCTSVNIASNLVGRKRENLAAALRRESSTNMRCSVSVSALQKVLNLPRHVVLCTTRGYHEHETGQDKKKKKKRKNGGGQQRLDAICLLPLLQWLMGDGKRTLCSALEDETLADRLMLVFL